jgi:spore coat polysaccharide biosynthesis protein SpsF (cytidylyltransferase family)
MTPRTGIVIQARVGSTRLPGKVLVDVAGVPLLERLYRRLSTCPRVDLVAVATTADSAPVIEFCKRLGIPWVLGPEEDLLTRYLRAAGHFRLARIVRVTADNPLTDPIGIDDLLATQAATGAVFVHNKHGTGYPYGTGAEVFRYEALLRCDRAFGTPAERAGVFGALLGRSSPVPAVRVPAPPALVRPDYFLTVDYPEDLKLVTTVYERFEGRSDVALADVVAWLDGRPDLVAINRHLHTPFADVP